MTSQIRALLVLAVCTVPLLACPSGTQGFAFVSDVNGAYRPEGQVGSTFIVEGIQFGDVQGGSNVYFTNNLGLAALPAPITNWAADYAIGTVPVGAQSGPISVNNGNGSNLGLTFFTVTPPAAFNPATLAWTAAGTLPGAGLSGHAVAFTAVGNATSAPRILYVTGGADSTGTPGTTVYYATVPAGGAPGAWATTTPLPSGLAFHSAVVTTSANSSVTSTTGYLMVIGGATNASGTSTGAILHAPLNADGTLGSWTSAGALPNSVVLHSLAAIVYMGHLYVVGGATSANKPVATVYRAVIQPDGTIKSGDWATENSLKFPRSHLALGRFDTRLYAIGGDSGTITLNDSLPSASSVTDVEYATVDLFSRDVGTWTKNGTGLPAGRMAATAVVGGAPGAGRILVSGGVYSGAPTGEEQYASINADGSVAAFQTAAATINAICSCNIFNHAATGYVNANGEFHALVVGGDNQNAPSKKRKESFTY